LLFAFAFLTALVPTSFVELGPFSLFSFPLLFARNGVTYKKGGRLKQKLEGKREREHKIEAEEETKEKIILFPSLLYLFCPERTS
jgi:hypothetical protein